MSANANAGVAPSASQGNKGKKANKRKKNTAKTKPAEAALTNGDVGERDVDDGRPESTQPDATETARQAAGRVAEGKEDIQEQPSADAAEPDGAEVSPDSPATPCESNARPRQPTSKSVHVNSNGDAESEMEGKLQEMSEERQSLQIEVKGLRESLQEVQEKYDNDMSSLRNQLQETQTGKDHAELQYRNLLGKLNTIKSQLGERLKADAEDLSQARTQIEKLDVQNKSLRDSNESLQGQIKQLHHDGDQRSKELSMLRNRTTLSQQNWLKEREELLDRESMLREEFEAAKQAMQDWEVLAMEERSIRGDLAERSSVLEEQLSSQKEAHERAASERDHLSLTVDGLQPAFQDLQNARKRELRELVDGNQRQVEGLEKQMQDVEKAASESRAALEAAQSEVQRALPFEAQVKEKNLLIGKLRHEAVILNDHLTKALRFLRRGKPEDNVDRHIVTNHFLQFLALDRADPKKFQVLQLIAALLNWTDEQREQAGLTRPGTASNSHSLRTPLSPYHRTPSTPSINSDYYPDRHGAGRKESLAELWSNFLEQEAQVDSKAPATSPSPTKSGGN
ncbi:MAG: hypothetical protein M1815_003780 [Lichina confinis]|nr:MAG: hypothetical protein M1815_003780 [Lichina confinis]